MKTWILTIVALLTSVVAVAQRREGTCTVQPKVGLNVSTLSDAQKTIGDACFGMEAEYMITNIFSLSAGVMVSNQGGKYDKDGLRYTADLDYANIPIMANVYVLPGLALKAGVQPGFRLKAKMKTDDGTYDVDEFYKLVGMLTPGEEPKVYKFDLAIPVGISYEYENVVLDARYNWGLLKVENIGNAYYNRVFEVTLGYKFELDF
ncbi:PorT family protein [Prevotella communis]|uniref:porin family protein n=1 Tax=Prevotella communis TaxID=2913614 RepID=UPI001EDA1953|nr:porin family protein [Prevotella communis]UKK66887.1 PorT family protein [Prevotella communis]UKK70974.1 PorT family protein [Prevotella communis]